METFHRYQLSYVWQLKGFQIIFQTLSRKIWQNEQFSSTQPNNIYDLKRIVHKISYNLEP